MIKKFNKKKFILKKLNLQKNLYKKIYIYMYIYIYFFKFKLSKWVLNNLYLKFSYKLNFKYIIRYYKKLIYLYKYIINKKFERFKYEKKNYKNYRLKYKYDIEKWKLYIHKYLFNLLKFEEIKKRKNYLINIYLNQLNNFYYFDNEQELNYTNIQILKLCRISFCLYCLKILKFYDYEFLFFKIKNKNLKFLKLQINLCQCNLLYLHYIHNMYFILLLKYNNINKFFDSLMINKFYIIKNSFLLVNSIYDDLDLQQIKNLKNLERNYFIVNLKKKIKYDILIFSVYDFLIIEDINDYLFLDINKYLYLKGYIYLKVINNKFKYFNLINFKKDYRKILRLYR